MIRIIPYEKCVEQNHVQFASKYWTKARRKIPEYIYWKFRGDQNQKLKSFILAVENDIVVGQLGLIPVKINVNSIEYEAQWACDLMVDKDYRGKGVAKMLYDYAHELKEITIGSDPSPLALKSMTKNGYLLTKSSWKFIFPVNLFEVFRLKKINWKFLKYIPNPFLIIPYFIGFIFKDNYHILSINEANEYFSKENRNEFNYVIRDKSFIKWRFQKFEDYYKGIDVLVDNKKNMYSGYYNNDTFYMTDFKMNSVLSFIILINSVLSKFKSSGIKSIRFFSNDNKLTNSLSFLGFIKFRTRNRIIFYTKNSELQENMKSKEFYYSYADSDDNI
jgi:GNAT superfamily N-acetyltransferase